MTLSFTARAIFPGLSPGPPQANIWAKECQLIQGLRQKSRVAYEYLYDHYAPVLLGVLIQMVKDPQLAEDLLQESFLKVFKSIESYEPTKGRFFTWLLRLVRNTGIDHIRYKMPRGVGRLQQEQVDKQAFVTSSFNDDSLKQVISKCLTENYKIIIDLIYFQGFTHQETADYLAIPLGTVKTRLHMSLQLLKATLSNDRLISNDKIVVR